MTPELIAIPAGAFVMGHAAFPNASPQHKIELAAFRIGKYPVTNAEYREFIQAGGYTHQEYWTKMGWRWLESRPQQAPGFWSDPRFNGERQPVVGVSWYEAVAYCNWLGHAFRLPTEAEWEKAARGDSDARNFPWGDKFDFERSNTAEHGLGRTTPVDMFPLGASPFSVTDMAGNVFEWTLSKWGKNWQELEFFYPYHPGDGREDIEGSGARIMRGGSWFNRYNEAHVSNRARYLAGSRGSNIGFRIVEQEEL